MFVIFRRPIEERVVHALGKAWHVEHFVCAKCEKPFFGTRHYEKKGLAYCEIHYHQLFGNICFTCNSVISGDGEYNYVYTCTVKPVNKGHPREKQNMFFIDKWSLFGGYFVSFYKGRVIEV